MTCLREFFTENSISRNTYICALHWPGEKGPSAEFPDPLKANFTPAQARRACAPKRKAPKSRVEPVTKKAKVVNKNCGEELNDFIPTTLVTGLAIYSQLCGLKIDSGFLFPNSAASQINSGVMSEKQNGCSSAELNNEMAMSRVCSRQRGLKRTRFKIQRNSFFCYWKHIPILSVFKEEISFRRDLGGVESFQNLFS